MFGFIFLPKLDRGGWSMFLDVNLLGLLRYFKNAFYEFTASC